MRMPEFSDVPPVELRALAARSHVLCVPEKRWLLRDGRDMGAFFYLLKGSIETMTPQRKWRSRPFGRLHYFYPGCDAVRTLGAVQVLRVDATHRDFVLQGIGRQLSMTSLTAEQWLEKFLSSHMMRQLPTVDWQTLLSAFQPRRFASGDKIVEQGATGSECFVLESGHAVIHRGRTTLCHLSPGDFFGEDSLVLACRRNADVTALEDVRVHAVEQHIFAHVLLENLVQFVTHNTHGRMLSLDETGQGVVVSLADIRQQAAALDPRLSYYVSGGERRERALCALLLLQRGLKASPLADQAGTVRSLAQARSDEMLSARSTDIG